MTKWVIKSTIGWFYNEKPINLPQLMHSIPKKSGKFLWKMISSYQSLILNIENTFNKNNNLKINHRISSQIIYGQNLRLLWRLFFFFNEGPFQHNPISFRRLLFQYLVSILPLTQYEQFNFEAVLYIPWKETWKYILYHCSPSMKNLFTKQKNGNAFQGISYRRYFSVARHFEIIFM